METVTHPQLARLKAVMRADVQRWCAARPGRPGRSRAQFVDALNAERPAGAVPVTLTILQHWLEDSERRRIPADMLDAWTRLCGPGVLQALAAPARLRVVSDSDSRVIPLGRALADALQTAARLGLAADEEAA